MRLFDLFLIILISLITVVVLAVLFFTRKENSEIEDRKIVMANRLSLEGRGSVRITNALTDDELTYKKKRSYILSQKLP